MMLRQGAEGDNTTGEKVNLVTRDGVLLRIGFRFAKQTLLSWAALVLESRRFATFIVLTGLSSRIINLLSEKRFLF